MEKVPAITHDVRLNVSFDSPHQGSNIPIGFQAATLHLAGSGILVGVPGAVPTSVPFGSIFSDLGKAANLANAAGSRQMLRYQVTGSGDAIQIDNSQFTTFMNEYHALGLPVQGGIRNISIADGSECGTRQPFADNAGFVNINKKYKLSTVAFLLGLASDPASQAFDFFKPNLLGDYTAL